MAEYIFGDRIIAQHKYGGVTVETVKMNAEMRERIVRCRDCKYAVEHRSKSILGAELVTSICSGPIQGAYSEGADVGPDGFCAWGEPREGGE